MSGGMDAEEVVRVVDWLDERSVVYQVNGGWAVDALVWIPVQNARRPGPLR